MAERLPPGSYDFESNEQNHVVRYADVNGDENTVSNGSIDPTGTLTRTAETEESIRHNSHSPESRTSNGNNEYPNGTSNFVESKDSAPPRDEENNDFKPRSPVTAVATTTTTSATSANQVEAEWIEQYEHGVYITLVALRDGTRDLKRVRFRYVLFFEK